MISGAHAVLWVRQDGPGNDACRFADAERGYLIDGSSKDADDNTERYRIRARGDGTTRRLRIGAKSRIFVRRAPDDTWVVNDTSVPAVTGAKDVDFGFTPGTFTLPIRRLKLGVGNEAEILVATWDLEKERPKPLHLVFRRISNNEYECLKTETGTTSNLLGGRTRHRSNPPRSLDWTGLIRSVAYARLAPYWDGPAHSCH